MNPLPRTLLIGALAAACGALHAEPIYALTVGNQLLSFDSATPGIVTPPLPITGLVGGDSILALDLRPSNGQLYGLGSGSRLYQLNPLTGAATQVGSSGAFTLTGFAFGFDFDPVADSIRVVSEQNQNLRLNPNNGTLTSADTTLAYAALDPRFGLDPNVGAVAYNNNFPGASSTTLYDLDLDAGIGILATQNPQNNGTLNTVGLLNVNGADLSFLGFDISGLTGTAYASLIPIAALPNHDVLPNTGFGFSELFTVNLATGGASFVGAIGVPGAFLIRDITAGATVPEASTWSAAAALGTIVVGLARRRSRVRLSRQ